MLHMLDPVLTWTRGEIGLECEFIEVGSNIRWLIQLVPEIFVVSEDLCFGPNNEMRFTPTGQEPDILRGDRLPAGVDRSAQLNDALSQAVAETSVGNADDQGQVMLEIGALTDLERSVLDFHRAGGSLSDRLLHTARFYTLERTRTYFGDRHRGDGRGLYGNYGERHGITWFKPAGWVGRKVKLSVEDFQQVRSWPIVYHGTSFTSASHVLYDRLRRAGTWRSVLMAHGRAGARQLPNGARVPTIYLSPALGYASYPVYAPLHELGDERWVQAVLEVKVRPGSYRARANTLSATRHWPRHLRIDPNFRSHENLEFLVEDESDVRVIGVLFRELGNVDQAIFGEVARMVRGRPAVIGSDGRRVDGPEFEWVDILKNHYEREGYFADQDLHFDHPAAA